MESLLKKVFETYRQMFKKPFVVIISVLYVVSFFAYFIYKSNINQERKYQLELDNLRENIKRQDEILRKLNSNLDFSFYTQLKIREEVDTTVEANLLRLLEYATLAEEKQDFEYALKIYNDAEKLIYTSLVGYNKSKIFYKQGKVENSIKELRKAIENDTSILYPEMRLVLSVILQTNNSNGNEEIIRLLKQYIE